jgi:predicted DsbA family dithiol-disulfide isomerase
MGKIQALPQDQLQALGTKPPRESAAIVVRAAGLDEFFRQRGMPSSQIESCLGDPAGLEKVAEIKRKAVEMGVSGTPTFFINGKVVDGVAAWRGLEPAIREEIG